MTPIIVVTNRNNYTQECLESPEMSDLQKKILTNEQFTDEDMERLTECKEKLEQKRSKKTVVLLIAIAIVIIVYVVVTFRDWKNEIQAD